MKSKGTMIRVSKDTLKKLQEAKTHPRESYEDTVIALLDARKEMHTILNKKSEKEPEWNQSVAKIVLNELKKNKINLL